MEGDNVDPVDMLPVMVEDFQEGEVMPGDGQASEAVVISGTDSPGDVCVAGDLIMPDDETVPGYLEP
jgi:hypothetical protein